MEADRQDKTNDQIRQDFQSMWKTFIMYSIAGFCGKMACKLSRYMVVGYNIFMCPKGRTDEDEGQNVSLE